MFRFVSITPLQLTLAGHVPNFANMGGRWPCDFPAALHHPFPNLIHYNGTKASAGR